MTDPRDEALQHTCPVLAAPLFGVLPVMENGQRVTRKKLEVSDKIEFGAQDSYHLLFALDGAELKRLMEQVAGGDKQVPGVGSNLGKLRELGAPVASIGGAGTFDGVFLTGIVAVLLA